MDLGKRRESRRVQEKSEEKRRIKDWRTEESWEEQRRVVKNRGETGRKKENRKELMNIENNGIKPGSTGKRGGNQGA